VRAALAPVAARHGKALLLEKPLGARPPRRAPRNRGRRGGGGRQPARPDQAVPPGDPRLPPGRPRLDAAGARACYLHGAFLGGDLATGWRLEHGALLDLGPHLLLDLLDAAVGPITHVRGTGDSHRWIELTCEHENGAVSQASLSGSVTVPRVLTRVELFGSTRRGLYLQTLLDEAVSR
jgi:hypothetical protein